MIKDKTVIILNDNPIKCIIKEIDDVGMLVEYATKDVVFHSLSTMNKIEFIKEDWFILLIIIDWIYWKIIFVSIVQVQVRVLGVEFVKDIHNVLVVIIK